MNLRQVFGLGMLFAALGCATGGRPRITAESLGSCDVEAPGNEDWRQVVAEGISFCVPADWTAMGKSGWRGGSASLTWGYGEPRGRVRSTKVVVRASEMPPSPPIPTQQWRVSEQIGGIPVDLWLTEWSGEFYTGATWDIPRSMYMTGEAASQRDADILLGVYRTLRVRGSVVMTAAALSVGLLSAHGCGEKAAQSEPANETETADAPVLPPTAEDEVATRGLFTARGGTMTPPNPNPASDGASGSGCAPGTTSFPDGAWFGFVRDWDRTGMSFDLACFYFGEIAYEKRGRGGVPDFFITNESSVVRHVSIDPGTPAYRLDRRGVLETVTYAEWVDDPGDRSCPGENCIVWLFINDGIVTEVMWAYTP